MVGAGLGAWETEVSQWVPRQVLVIGCLGDEVFQQLSQNVKFAYN